MVVVGEEINIAESDLMVSEQLIVDVGNIEMSEPNFKSAESWVDMIQSNCILNIAIHPRLMPLQTRFVFAR
jgi:hypothetical protein